MAVIAPPDAAIDLEALLARVAVGKSTIGSEFVDPPPEEELRAWEGGDEVEE